jgi:CheY-like chemotaxis protein
MAEVGLLEDNTRIAKLCAIMLQYVGHRVTIYGHPRECLNALLPQFGAHDSGKPSIYQSVTPPPLPVDVLILDLHLPEIDGVEVLRCLSSHPRTQSLPLIFCTAATQSEIARALRVAPHASFVEKPFKMQSLASAIAKALGERMR